MSSELTTCGTSIVVRHLGRQSYEPVWRAMQRFTQSRDSEAKDEFWVLEHEPVFTQGQAGRPEHILNPGDVPVVQVDRGGQVTYHGPGQLVVYLLINIKRRKLGARALVTAIEQSIVSLLSSFGIQAAPRSDAPGVYVNGAKIASLGLRIKRGCSFHGLSLNCQMDLTPFTWINPCGHEGMPVTQMADLIETVHFPTVESRLIEALQGTLGYTARCDYNGIPNEV